MTAVAKVKKARRARCIDCLFAPNRIEHCKLKEFEYWITNSDDGQNFDYVEHDCDIFIPWYDVMRDQFTEEYRTFLEVAHGRK